MAGIRIVNTSVKETIMGMENASVYPNPSSGDIYFQSLSSFPVQMDVINIVGEKVYAGRAVKQMDGSILLFNKNEAGLKEGIYFIRISQGDQTGYSRILLK